ncbi:DIP1984 family protein [Paenibacillus endoradicis]|uniref:DIP1984 family protein n=1 Tax=Paenibacillus endoradicis TaxID=2972487 RepID=UPI002158B501|nr:DIP1984 family protein [Paenibacillus endoradicis]MCR8659704.1 DIP1984 family protein [Paenibacillus endoradicis]
MKLAEALLYRADAQKKIAQLKQRLERVIKVQEGEQPSEDPVILLEELKLATIDMTLWIQRVNRTNAITAYNDQLTLSDALIERDRIMMYRNALATVLEQACITQDRYSRTEVRFERTVDVKEIQKEIDILSKTYREMDIRIQELNWTVELIIQ